MTVMERSVGVVIVAGGSGLRCGGSIPKQFRLLGGRPLLARTIEAFARALPAARIVVVLPAAHIAFWRDLAARFDLPRHTVVEGGAERFHSVARGLDALPDDVELIAVHDGVRPLVTTGMIRRVAEAAEEHGAAVPVVPVVDSFRETDGAGGSHAVDRSRLRIVQTPQIFRGWLLREAYGAGYRPEFTDDASVAEAAGHTVFLAEGERSNLKITTPEDLTIAEAILRAREEEQQPTDTEDGAHL